MVDAVLRDAERRCLADARTEQHSYGVLPPCRSIDPLWPPLSLAEYEMMERDTAKYLLYHAAIDAAAARLVAEADPPSPLRMVVIGPGGGRLVEYCVAACKAHGGPGSSVLALDANPLAVTMSRARFAPYRPAVGGAVSVVVADPFTLLPGSGSTAAHALPADAEAFRGQCHIGVAELLGSFGCNEFLPELMATISSIFLLPDRIPGDRCETITTQSYLIPRDWTTWVTPIHCPSVRRYLGLLKKPTDAAYVVGFPPDAIALAPAQRLFSAPCDVAARKYSGVVEVTAALQPPPPGAMAVLPEHPRTKRQKTGGGDGDGEALTSGCRCDGWLGYFTSTLCPRPPGVVKRP
jgi:hypothetical protein